MNMPMGPYGGPQQQPFSTYSSYGGPSFNAYPGLSYPSGPMSSYNYPQQQQQSLSYGFGGGGMNGMNMNGMNVGMNPFQRMYQSPNRQFPSYQNPALAMGSQPALLMGHANIGTQFLQTASFIPAPSITPRDWEYSRQQRAATHMEPILPDLPEPPIISPV